MSVQCDCSGWVTKYNVRCGDGLTIKPGAFKDCDGVEVPLVYSHQHNDPDKVLGKVRLEHRDDGVYGYAHFNDTPNGQLCKELVRHRDITSFSIFANRLTKNKNDVMHGNIREVSLVLAGANPEAIIVDASGLAHGDSEGDVIIWSGEDLEFAHDDMQADEESKPDLDDTSEVSHADTEKTTDDSKKNKEDSSMADEKTVGEVIDSMTTEQKNVLYALIAEALDTKGGSASQSDISEEEDDSVKHNIFDSEPKQNDTLSHDEMMAVIGDAKRYGSMKESFLQHGIEDVEWLFPDDKLLDTPPQWIRRDNGWVSGVMNGVRHIPFSRFKSMFADITEDEARAKGYIKGNLKKEQVFSLLKRSTTPQTVYKKQKMDRDDVVDITSFDVIAWLKQEMRFMLDEEIARAILIGDGRLASDDDKISEDHIRPIWKDEDLFTIKVPVEVATGATADQRAKTIIRAAIKSRKNYKGSGNPVFYTTEDLLTDMLLIEDTNGRVIYESQEKLATALRVSKIITVPVMESQTRTDAAGKNFELLGLIVNLSDYTVGADKGGAVSMFDDFDLDYNAQKYLIETRCSGALTKPYSAIALEIETA